MSLGKSKADPPDYTGAAQATSAGNQQNLQYQTQANRPDMVTPWGTSTWDAGEDGNTWTNTVKLSGDQQRSLDSQNAIQMGQSQLAQTLQGQTSNAMQSGFNAPNTDSYFSSVPGVQSSFQSFSPNGVGGVNQQRFNGANVNTNAQSAVSGAGPTNLNAPQFSTADSQAGATAAYNASTELLKDQWGQDTAQMESKLRMQGLTPGSEAYDSAMQNLTRTQGQQQNQLANQAVITGNNMANQNYSSALSGYNAGNAAQNQAYSQGASTFQMGNDASLNRYNSQLAGQSATNQAQQQAYNQALASYGADTAAQQSSNQAQQQAYDQASSRFQTDYSTALQNYLQPLNSMNAVLTGQQVQNPQFNSYAQSGYVPGTDYSGAASALGQWSSGQSAANNAMMGGFMNAAASAAGSYFSDARLKTNIQRIGTTEGGIPWYSWDWKDGRGHGRGVIAQEVMHIVPGAVHLADNDMYYVEYDKLA